MVDDLNSRADSRDSQVCRLIVLTGGPGAGKTAVLELARRIFVDRVAFLPEAAGIIFQGGFWRRPSIPARKAAQRAIYHVQNEQERLVLEERQSPAGICDRGTLDGLAYWPESEESFFAAFGTSRAAELARYHAIIHLHTPAASNGYNHQNPLRRESAEEARDIDERIVNAWSGHPLRIFIDSSTDFAEKAARALVTIRAHLPAALQGAAPSLEAMVGPVTPSA